MIKIIFFDFDGTIVESFKIHKDALIETLEKYGIDYDKKAIVDMLGIRLNVIFKTMGIKIKHFEKFRNDFYESLVKKTSLKTIKKSVDLNPLKSLKFPLIVVSNSKTKYLEKAIEVLKLQKIFDKIYGGRKV